MSQLLRPGVAMQPSAASAAFGNRLVARRSTAASVAAMKNVMDDKVPLPRYAEVQWGEQKTLIASTDVRSGSEVYSVPRLPMFLRPEPDRHSVQTGSFEHLDFARALPAASLTHHECDPNGDLEIRADAAVFVARHDIAAGEILSFDYNTTEWEMSSPFECRCGSDTCVGTVAGFKLLPLARRAAIAPRCSPAVRELAVQEGLWPLHSVDAS